MGAPREVRIPGHVPDELVARYGTTAADRQAARAQLVASVRATDSAGDRLIGLALFGCLAMVAGVLVALVATTPVPSIAAAALTALVGGAGTIGLRFARALLRRPHLFPASGEKRLNPLMGREEVTDGT